jgi:outer membrane lipoprotein-sorting protein
MIGLLALLYAVMEVPAVAEAPPTTAQPSPALKSVLSGLEQRYGKAPSLQAAFVQTTTSVLYGDDTQKGTVALERPDKMHWVFVGDGREFICDGKTLWIWAPKDKQVLRFKDAGKEVSAAQAVLQSLHRVGELFQAEVVSSDPMKGHVLGLTPRPGDPPLFSKLTITLDPGYGLRQVEVLDAQGTRTTLVFSNVVLGTDLPDDLFTFVAPPGAEVVDAN